MLTETFDIHVCLSFIIMFYPHSGSVGFPPTVTVLLETGRIGLQRSGEKRKEEVRSAVKEKKPITIQPEMDFGSRERIQEAISPLWVNFS